MIYKKEEFIFDHIDEAFKDYWFRVVGETQKELTDKYMDMCMISVTDVVYSAAENICGIKRLFPFNCDVIASTDNELKELLEKIVFTIKQN